MPEVCSALKESDTGGKEHAKKLAAALLTALGPMPMLNVLPAYLVMISDALIDDFWGRHPGTMLGCFWGRAGVVQQPLKSQLTLQAESFTSRATPRNCKPVDNHECSSRLV
jgi:hypothetical protein